MNKRASHTKASGLIEILLKEPEHAIEKLDLVYLDRNQLGIERQKENDDFFYTYRGKRLDLPDQLERINALVIPPAWENVKIAHIPNGHLQAVGKDLKKRTQYRYHALWSKVRNQTKFYKMARFGNRLPDIRQQVDKDLELQGWPRAKVLALIIRLMEETHIRIGNDQYARKNKTYGLSTLRSRHLTITKDKLRFEFVGKRGKEHRITLNNKRLIRLVNQCEEIPGWELFKFYDKEGNKCSVDSSMVNEYIHEHAGQLFTAKDFRTWAATIVFFEHLLDLPPAMTDKEKQANILSGFDAAAKALGNTRNVCRKYYVHPLLVEEYTSGGLNKAFQKVDRLKETSTYFTKSETVLLELLQAYTPEWAQSTSNK